jgi:catechol 2,3-dioxygenase-like lactoylglutathione lyase family enzyme
MIKILCIAGFATITEDPASSAALYQDMLGLSFRVQTNYLFTDNLEGAKHFGIWPLQMAAQSCFGSDIWPTHIPKPQATIEFELEDIEAIEAAVAEMQASGYQFVHGIRLEPWGQTLARLLSPEGLLIGLSYAPWLHLAQSQ